MKLSFSVLQGASLGPGYFGTDKETIELDEVFFGMAVL